jgi:hypothetical protein
VNLTCVHTGWTWTRSVSNNAHAHILAALKTAVEEVPSEVVGMDFDNATEFLNKPVINGPASGRSSSPGRGPTRRTIRPPWSWRIIIWRADTRFLRRRSARQCRGRAPGRNSVLRLTRGPVSLRWRRHCGVFGQHQRELGTARHQALTTVRVM